MKSVADIYSASVNGLLEVIDRFEEMNLSAKTQVATDSYTTPSIWQFAQMVWQHNKLKPRLPA